MRVRVDQEIPRFLFVGAGSNVANFLCYMALLYVHAPVFAAAVCGYLIGLVCSYHFGRTWVFDRRFNVNLKNIARFLVVYFVGGVGMSTITTVLINGLMFNYATGWLIGATFAVCNNFIGSKFLVFGPKRCLAE